MSLRSDTKAIQRIVNEDDDGIWGPRSATATLRMLQGLVATPTEDVIDKRTLKNLRTLEPKAQKKFLPFIRQAQAIAATMGCDYKAISGTRSKKEQNALYAKGRTKPGPKVTNARYGYSNHNFGLALDFGVFAGGKYLDSSKPSRADAVHRAVGAIAKRHGIDWGGNWTSFKDRPHFEVKVGLSTKQKRARLFAGKSMFD